MKRIKDGFKRLWSLIRKPEMKVLPGHLAFFLILSVMALLVIIGLVASSFNISMTTLLSFLEDSIPADVGNLLLPLVQGKNGDVNVLIFTIVGLIFASNGPHAIVLTSNTLYNFKESSGLSDRVKAVIMTIVLVGIFLFVALFLGYGNHIVHWLLEVKALANIKNEIYYTFLILKWPVALFLLFINIKILYTLAPDKRIKSKTVNRGAIFTTLGWFIATYIYSFYVGTIVNYNIFYGALSSIIVLMMWIYIISYIFVIGIAINADFYNKTINLANTNNGTE